MNVGDARLFRQIVCRLLDRSLAAMMMMRSIAMMGMSVVVVVWCRIHHTAAVADAFAQKMLDATAA